MITLKLTPQEVSILRRVLEELPDPAKPNATNVRLGFGSKGRLVRIAKAYGITPSDLVRTAVAEKLPEWEEKGVSLARVSA